MRRWLIFGTMSAVTVIGLVTAVQADADEDEAVAILRDVDGARVGTVEFTSRGAGTHIDVRLVGNAHVTTEQFHGLHVHANDVAATGSGCVADAGKPSTSWFMSADGHLAEPGQTHGAHVGDLPSPLVQENGRAVLSFATDRLDLEELIGKAVILHAGADNFGNVPVGSGPEQYTANSPAARTRTQSTGNAGDRMACGVIRED
jgi:superoxide dismutase, Cu-Zn family